MRPCSATIRRKNPASWARSASSSAADRPRLTLDGHLIDSHQGFPTRLRQIERMRASIGRAGPPLDEAEPAQVVNQAHEPTREDSQSLGQRLLAETVGLPDHPEDSHVRRLQAERREPLGEFRRRMRAHLRKEKSQVGGRVRRAGSRARSGHCLFSRIVIYDNDYRPYHSPSRLDPGQVGSSLSRPDLPRSWP